MNNHGASLRLIAAGFGLVSLLSACAGSSQNASYAVGRDGCTPGNELCDLLAEQRESRREQEAANSGG